MSATKNAVVALCVIVAYAKRKSMVVEYGGNMVVEYGGNMVVEYGGNMVVEYGSNMVGVWW